LTGITEEEMVDKVYFQVSQGIRNGWTTREVIGKIEDLKVEGLKNVLTIARTNASNHFNNARLNLFFDKDVVSTIEAFQYNAIIDASTTQFCASHHGQIIKKSDPDFSFMQPPNHFNCRSTIEPIFIGEDEDKDSFYHKYDEKQITVNGKKVDKYPEWGSGHNSSGKTFDMGDTNVSKPAKGFGR
jgi:SPP1 gp7 family putative phage head morphogenesis protein